MPRGSSGCKRKEPASDTDVAVESPKRSRTSDISASSDASPLQTRAQQKQTSSAISPAQESIEISLDEFDGHKPLRAEQESVEEVAANEDGTIDWKIFPFSKTNTTDITDFFDTSSWETVAADEKEDGDNEDEKGQSEKEGDSDHGHGEDIYDDLDSMDLDDEPAEADLGAAKTQETDPEVFEPDAMDIDDVAMDSRNDQEAESSYQLWYMVGNMSKQAVVNNVVHNPEHWHV